MLYIIFRCLELESYYQKRPVRSSSNFIQISCGPLLEERVGHLQRKARKSGVDLFCFPPSKHLNGRLTLTKKTKIRHNNKKRQTSSWEKPSIQFNLTLYMWEHHSPEKLCENTFVNGNIGTSGHFQKTEVILYSGCIKFNWKVNFLIYNFCCFTSPILKVNGRCPMFESMMYEFIYIIFVSNWSIIRCWFESFKKILLSCSISFALFY